MRIQVNIHNQAGQHEVRVSTDNRSQSIEIPPKPSGQGSSVNGGELLFLALATCYCNDIYREAAKQGIEVTEVSVEVEGEFGGPGDPAQSIVYRARVTAHASQEAIHALMEHTDRMAEIQNMLRGSTPVTLAQIEAVAIPGVSGTK